MKKSEQSLARIFISFCIHRGILTPKKSFAKNNTNSDLSSGFVLFAYGGDKGIRTPDLYDANVSLYQLSHIPITVQCIIMHYLFEIKRFFGFVILICNAEASFFLRAFKIRGSRPFIFVKP